MDGVGEAYEILTGKLEGWAEGLVAAIPNLVVALLVLVASFVIGAFAGRLIGRGVGRITDTQAISRLVDSLAKIAVILVGASVALGVLGLDKAVTSILAGAGVLGLVVGIAFQDLAANFIAGVMMGFRKPFKIGDVIETEGVMGRVSKLNLRNTLVENFDGQMVIIPNRRVFESPLVNYSYTGARRIVIPVGVRYDSDLEGVIRVTTAALEALEFRDRERPADVVARAFGSSSIDFHARFWIRYPSGVDYFKAHSDAMIAIKAAFDDAGFEIPFPIRTLDPGLLGEAGWSQLLSDDAEPGRSGANGANGADNRPS